MTKEDISFWWEYYIVNPFRDWIYPGYKWRNLFFNRTNIVKLHNFSPFEYTEVCFRMFEANMELIVDFIEKDHPEKYTNWYDEEYGPKFESKYFPELNGKFVMDVIKQVYNYYKVDLPKQDEESSYLCKFWADNFFYFKECEDNPEFFTLEEHNYTLEDIEKMNPNWNIILKYIPNKEDIVIPRKLNQVLSDIRLKEEKDAQYYLHLCIELRKFLVS